MQVLKGSAASRCATQSDEEKDGFRLRGRTAIVCAASMGLGRSCATALGGEGVKLVVVARRREILERAADEIRSATGTETVAVVT
jgi:3-oxoacyl-[acyl-carrier protein] reductase